MKKLNKFFAVLVALAMMATLCVSMAFAEDAETYDPADAKIVKYLKIPEGVTIPDDTFTFTFNQVATDTVTATDLAKNEYKALAIANVTFSAKDMIPSASTNDDGSLVYAYDLGDLADMDWPKAGEYKYTVKELLPSKTAREGEDEATQKSNGTYAANTQEYTLRVYVTNQEVLDENEEPTGETEPAVSGITVQNETQENDPKVNPTIPDPSDDGDEDDENDPSNITDANVTGFTFVNTYTQADEEKPTGNGDYGAFYAQKNTSGTYGDKTQAFPITITVTFDDYNGDKALDLKNADGETIAELEEVSTNVWAQTVNLKDGEIAYFENLPDGASVSVVEDLTTDPGSAITNAAFYQQTSASVTAGGTAASGTVVDKDGNTYTATKSKDVFALTKITAAAVVYNDANADKANNVNINNESKYDPGATGILLSNLPYIVLALVAIGGMVAYVVIRRRQSDEA